MDEDPFAGLGVCARDEGTVGGGGGDVEACGVLEAPLQRDGQEGVFGREDVGCVGALGGAEDAIALLELGGPFTRGGCRDDGAREFGAGDPR